MATLSTGYWLTAYNLLPGQTHNYFADVGTNLSLKKPSLPPPETHGWIYWFAAQPITEPLWNPSYPEQALAVTVYYVKVANSNALQVNVVVQNVGTNAVWAYNIFYAVTKWQ